MRVVLWKIIKWNQTNHVFFVSSKRNYEKAIQQYNEFNKVIKQNGYTIYTNSKNSKSSDPHRLLLNLSDKTNLKRSEKYVTLSNLIIHYTWKNMKKSYKYNKFKISTPTWNKEFIDHISYQIFKIILNTSSKKHEAITDNASIVIYINKIENTIIFEIKTGYYLELLTPEKMKILRSNESKITKDENSKNVPRLQITEVLLIHCNIVNNNYHQDSRALYTFLPNKSFG